MAASELAMDLSKLWSDEYCAWSVRYDASWGRRDLGTWVVVLTWATDRDTRHGAEWVEYTWEFYGDTLDEALEQAFGWVSELSVWKPCCECDGLGEWAGIPCNDCNQTGLANQ